MPIISTAISENYIRWNARLLEYALSHGMGEDGRFFLTVRQMLEDEHQGLDAEGSFRGSVSKEYSLALRCQGDPVRYLSSQTDAQKRPLSIAFLGLSVLAAENMLDNGYYKRLAVLLRQPQQGSGVNGLVLTSFERAWRDLGLYLRRTQGCYIEEPESYGNRFVRWPRMHALLRAMDTAKLPFFFAWAQLSPNRSIAAKEVLQCFDSWVSSSICDLTPLGRRACNNEVSRPGILRQVLHVFEQWDGTLPLNEAGWSSGCSKVRSADACLIVDSVAGSAKIKVRTKRPDGFPERIALTGVDLIATSDGYYQDVFLPILWNKALAQGIIHSVAEPKARMQFRLKGAPAFAFLDVDRDGVYESATALRLDVRCGVLCQNSRADEVARYLRAICQEMPRKVNIAQALPGWALFHDFIPCRSQKPPKGLDLLAVDETLLIRPVGGLRFGRAQEWMCGAPPRDIELLGKNLPDEVVINGIPHRLTETVTEKFSEPGFYTIVAGRERYSLRIVAPTLGETFSGHTLFRTDEEEQYSDLEIGMTLSTCSDAKSPNADSRLLLSGLRFIGSQPGAVAPNSLACSSTARSGLAANWAIGTIEGQISVIALHRRPSPPVALARLSLLWANQILQASSARLGLLQTAQDPNDDREQEKMSVRSAWNAYLVAANRVRRSRHARCRRDEENMI